MHGVPVYMTQHTFFALLTNSTILKWTSFESWKSYLAIGHSKVFVSLTKIKLQPLMWSKVRIFFYMCHSKVWIVAPKRQTAIVGHVYSVTPKPDRWILVNNETVNKKYQFLMIRFSKMVHSTWYSEISGFYHKISRFSPIKDIIRNDISYNVFNRRISVIFKVETSYFSIYCREA